MKVRSAVLGSILVLTPTAALADSADGAAVINLLETADIATSATSPDVGLSTDSATNPASDSSGAADGYQILTAPLGVDEFFVAGVTWEGPAPGTVDIRVLEDEQWGEWYSLEIETGEGGRDGTEPFIAGGADGIQVRITGDELPADLDLALTNGEGGESPREEFPAQATVAPAAGSDFDRAVNADDMAIDAAQPELLQLVQPEADLPQAQAQADLAHTMSAMVAPPRIVDRSGWGETRVPPLWSPVAVDLGGAVIHHTAGNNNYSATDAPSVVRSVHDYHTYSWGRGWDDIGYNFLVDRFGTVYEGRYGSLESTPGKMVVGGHAAPANTGSVGISVMGTYTGSVQPSAASMTAIEDIIAWQFSEAGVDPNGTWTFYNTRLGRNSTVPAILGHRDVSTTICPGNIYPLLPSLRSSVATKMADVPEPWYGEELVLHKTNDFAPIANSVQYFGQADDEIYVGNVLGNGDLPFIRRGNEFIFAHGPQSPTATQVHTLGRSGQEVYTADIEGVGRDAVILRTGNRFDIYENLSVNTPTRTINYGRPGDEVFIFDWDGDGKDEIAVRRGNTFYLKWMVTSGNADREINYGRKNDEVYVGRWSKSANETITVRRGNRYFMSYSNVSGNADKEFNYGRATDRVVVGDWDRDGLDGLGVIRVK